GFADHPGVNSWSSPDCYGGEIRWVRAREKQSASAPLEQRTQNTPHDLPPDGAADGAGDALGKGLAHGLPAPSPGGRAAPGRRVLRPRRLLFQGLRRPPGQLLVGGVAIQGPVVAARQGALAEDQGPFLG